MFTSLLNDRRSHRLANRVSALQRAGMERLEERTPMTAAPWLPAETSSVVQAATPVARIINGTVTSNFPSVGQIGDDSGFFCSGTLIGSQYALTAGHCAEGVAQTAGRFMLGNAVYSTSQVIIHPNYNGNAIGSDSGNDLAIFKLNRAVTNIQPTPILRTAPNVGQLLTLVGFGAGGTGTSGEDGSFGTKRVGTTPIDAVSSRLISWNFDNNSESNTAPGDSGGPAFVTVANNDYVAGVTSGGDNGNAGLGDHSFDTRVDAYASWIDSIVGTTPGGSTSTLPTVSILATDASAAETASTQPTNSGQFTVTRTGSTTSPLVISLGISGSAANGTDYTTIPTSITIPAGASSTTLPLNVRDDGNVEGAETATITLLAGTAYSTNAQQSVASVVIADNDVATVKSNDNFADRQRLTGSSVSASGSNVRATRETGEPNVLNVSGGKSVWWTWTAPASGTVRVSTKGSDFDTTLGVYQGTSVSRLTLVRANDDENSDAGVYTSRLAFSAVAGQAYQIVVDGYDGENGSIRLSLEQPVVKRAPISPSLTTSQSAHAVDLVWAAAAADEASHRQDVHATELSVGARHSAAAWW